MNLSRMYGLSELYDIAIIPDYLGQRCLVFSRFLDLYWLKGLSP